MAASVVLARSASAHGLAERYNLPVPLWLYLAGAAAAVTASFLGLALLMREPPDVRTYPRADLLRWRVGRALAHPGVRGASADSPHPEPRRSIPLPSTRP